MQCEWVSVLCGEIIVGECAVCEEVRVRECAVCEEVRCE